MKVAALDLGSNSFLLLIVEVDNQGEIIKILHDEYQTVRLGEGVEKNKEFSPSALERAEKCFKKFYQSISLYQPQLCFAVSTSAARDVRNKSHFISLGHQYGFEIEIISGHDEAQLSFLGGVSGLNLNGSIRVLDIGGGSTEFILGEGPHIHWSKSINMGSVRLTERLITQQPLLSSEFRQLQSQVKTLLKDLSEEWVNSNAPLVAVAGTPTTVAALEIEMGVYDGHRIHGYFLTLEVMEKWCDKLMKMTVNERSRLNGMDPLRADVIVAGLVILIESVKLSGVSGVYVSDRGVRYGLALRGSLDGQTGEIN